MSDSPVETFVAQWGDGTQPDVGSFDEARCTMVLATAVNSPETEQTYEVRGVDTTTLTFVDDSLSGTSSLNADLFEAGTQVGSCTQSAMLTGQR